MPRHSNPYDVARDQRALWEPVSITEPFGTPLVADDVFSTYTGSAASVVVDSSITDPDGGTSAYKIQETTAGGAHGIFRTAAYAAQVHTFTVFLRPSDRNWAAVDYFNGGSDILNNVDLVTPAAGSVYTLGGFSNLTIAGIGNNWVFVSGRFTCNGAGNQNIGFFASTSDNGYSYTGTTGFGIHIYRARIYNSAISQADLDRYAAYYAWNLPDQAGPNVRRSFPRLDSSNFFVNRPPTLYDW